MFFPRCALISLNIIFFLIKGDWRFNSLKDTVFFFSNKNVLINQTMWNVFFLCSTCSYIVLLLLYDHHCKLYKVSNRIMSIGKAYCMWSLIQTFVCFPGMSIISFEFSTRRYPLLFVLRAFHKYRNKLIGHPRSTNSRQNYEDTVRCGGWCGVRVRRRCM